MKLASLIASSVVAVAIAGCSSAPEPTPEPVPPSAGIPDWVLNPVVEQGIAASDCVRASSNFSVDRKMAASNARVELARQIQIRVSNLDKTYSGRTDANEQTTTSNVFSSVAKLVTQEKLVGSQIVKTDLVHFRGQDHYCAMATIDPVQSKTIFDEVMQAADVQVDAQNEAFLYEEFKAFKAEQDLDKAIENLTN